MAVKVYLSGNSRQITLRGTDSEFEDTSLAGEDITIRARTLTPVEDKRLEREHVKVKRGDVKVDSDKLLEKRFGLMILGWEGLVDESGQPIPCTDEVKRSIAKNDPDLAREILTAVEERARRLRSQREEELGN